MESAQSSLTDGIKTAAHVQGKENTLAYFPPHASKEDFRISQWEGDSC